MKMMDTVRLPARVLALALLGAALAGPATAEEDAPFTKDGEPTYLVKDGQVDRGTYNGYRRFHSTCHTCHGFDASGSSFAPALVDSLKRLNFEQFSEVVINGRQVAGATGDRVMPSFGMDPNVAQHLGDIYRYLKARADGALPGGRPQRIGS
ncbi:MAG TPA: cytochrome c [Azospirillum sp.]